MTTRLDRPLKRELEIDGTVYTLTVTPDGMSLVLKGKRRASRWSGARSSAARPHSQPH